MSEPDNSRSLEEIEDDYWGDPPPPPRWHSHKECQFRKLSVRSASRRHDGLGQVGAVTS